MPTYEGFRLKMNQIRRELFAKQRGKALVQTDFTILSNNCWGGMIYESYHLQKRTPTVGLFFMAEDYIRFLSGLREYMSSELRFIRPEESRWKNEKTIGDDTRFGTYPIGRLQAGRESVELFFLHYRSEEEAKEKWERRKKRINWDRLLVKFNDQNGCTEKEVRDFLNLPYENKPFFTCRDWDAFADETYIRIRQFPKHDVIMASYEPFGRSRLIDITEVINRLS